MTLYSFWKKNLKDVCDRFSDKKIRCRNIFARRNEQSITFFWMKESLGAISPRSSYNSGRNLFRDELILLKRMVCPIRIIVLLCEMRLCQILRHLIMSLDFVKLRQWRFYQTLALKVSSSHLKPCKCSINFEALIEYETPLILLVIVGNQFWVMALFLVKCRLSLVK